MQIRLRAGDWRLEERFALKVFLQPQGYGLQPHQVSEVHDEKRWPSGIEPLSNRITICLRSPAPDPATAEGEGFEPSRPEGRAV